MNHYTNCDSGIQHAYKVFKYVSTKSFRLLLPGSMVQLLCNYAQCCRQCQAVSENIRDEAAPVRECPSPQYSTNYVHKSVHYFKYILG